MKQMRKIKGKQKTRLNKQNSHNNDRKKQKKQLIIHVNKEKSPILITRSTKSIII
jgi:hypothetical protein